MGGCYTWGDINATPGGDMDIQPGGGVQPAHTAGPCSILDVFAELDLLRTQATNIQAQLDGQREVSTGFARSITNIQHELQTLRDAYQSNSKIIDIAITTADESHAHMLEYKSAASNLTYQFHTVSTKVDNFLATQAQPTPPTDHSSTIEEAFAAADATISDGIASMQNEVRDRLDQEISSRTQQTSTPGVRFTNVTDRWSDREPYDSDAAYTAAHASSAAPTGTSSPSSSNPDGTTNEEFSTRAQDCSSTNTHCNTSPCGAEAYGDSLSPRFNGPTSPHYRLAITRGLSADILAWHAGTISGGDTVDGIDFLEDPDVGDLGITSELAGDVAEDHFNIVMNWVNPRWDTRDFEG